MNIPKITKEISKVSLSAGKEMTKVSIGLFGVSLISAFITDIINRKKNK